MYVDGKLVVTATDGTDYADTQEVTIGAQNASNSNVLNGFMSNVRIIKGTALYTSDFIPPTEPLTNVTNTKLLCCQSNTSTDAAAVQPSVTSYFTGGTALTWASSPIGSKWTLSNSNKNATSSGGSSGYTGADVFSVALAANTTYAWTLDVTNGDSTGGWYFADVQSNTGTHADQKGGNSLGLRGGETSAGYYGTFASANGGSNGENKISMNSNVSPNGAKSIDFVVYRPSSGTGKVWVKANDTATWIGGGNPSDTSSTATFIIPDGTTYFGFIDYDSGDTTNCNMRGDGDITSAPLTANGDAAATTFNPFNTDINTVRGQAGGYTTWNPLDTQGLDAGDLKDGNLSITHSAGNWLAVRANKFVSSGKWYYEVKVGNNQYTSFGVGSVDYKINPTGNDWMNVANVYGFYPYDGTVYDAGSSRSYTTADTSAAGNVYGIAIDMDNKTLRFYENGRDLGIAFDSTTTTNFVNKESVAPMAWLYNQSGTDEYNFGQKPFKFPPPDGFQPLSASTVRPDTVIARPDQYVSATLYTGNSDSSQDIDVGFAPDLVWQKIRSQAGDHALTDTVRGISGGYLQSEDQDAQKGNANDGISAFLPNGFRAYNGFNNNGLNWVSWCWKAGGSSNTFNIDDVGYANASDVNMSIAGLNNSVYNTDRVWSSGIANPGSDFDQAATNAFNGNRSNKLRTAGNSVLVTLNFSPALTVNNTVQILGEDYATSDFRYTVTVDGTTTTKDVNQGQPATFNVSGSLTQITVDNNGSTGRTYLEWIKVDGKELIDDGVTPPSVPSVPNTGCSVGTKQGFSIVAYNATGSNLTVNHGLSERPGFIILKSKNASGDWLVWHQSLSSDTHFLKLNETNSESQASNVFLSVDSNTFGTGDDSGINSGTQQKIAYIWHDVPGLQKFGIWTNNNSSDGAFVELGFKPAIVLLKDKDVGEDWYIIDSVRHPFNKAAPSSDQANAVNTLNPNTNHSEATSRGGHTNTTVDFLSNGFKIRTTNAAAGEISYGTRNYVYAAWAEAPQFNLYGAQSNAR